MKRIALFLILAAIVPLETNAFNTYDHSDVLSYVAMPLAVSAVCDVRGVQTDRVGQLVAYMDQANVPDLLPRIRDANIEGSLRDDKLSYFVSRIELVQGHAPGMSRWRKRLFIATSRITADAAEYFRLPRERTVIMGSRIEL